MAVLYFRLKIDGSIYHKCFQFVNLRFTTTLETCHTKERENIQSPYASHGTHQKWAIMHREHI